MDLRSYYSRIREVESVLSSEYVVLVSLDTSDGGKAGVLTETSRRLAAKQISEGSARAATEGETADFHHGNAVRKKEKDEAEALNRVQFVVMPQKHSGKPAKD